MITLPHINGRRKWLIVAITSGIVLILAGLYTWWSVQSWQRYDSSWHATQNAVKSDVAKAVSATPDTDKEYTEKRDALRRVVTTLQAHEHMCDVNTLTGWQQILHAPEASVKACEATQAKHVALESTLTDVTTYLNNEQALQKELVKLMPSKATTLDEKQWPAYSAAATAVQKKLNTLQLGDDYKPVVETAKKQLTTLVAAWKALNEAHKKEDRSAWQKAKGELVQAYAGIPTIADASDKALDTLLKNLKTASSTL